MMGHGAVTGEELHLAELLAQAGEELETFVDVVRRIGKVAAHHDNPTIDGRRNEKPWFELRGERIAPRTGARMLHAERGLDGLWILRTHREPAAGRLKDGGGKTRFAEVTFCFSAAPEFPPGNPTQHADANDD